MPSSLPTRDPAGGCLYVVATPIGHLEDITLRAIRTLRQVDLIAAEDTRHTRRLLAVHQVETPLISYHEHNERQRTAELIERLIDGAAIALVSDAGTPTVSDPGYRLIQAAAAHHLRIVPIPGVSAVMTALSAAGLPTDRFTFVGFPQRRKTRRMEELQRLADIAHTLIFYQSPRRITAFLAEIKAVLGDRPAVLARELTKLHEEFLRGRLSDIIAQLAQRPEVKGECTLLVGGAQALPPSPQDLEAAIAASLAEPHGSLSDLARELGRRFQVPRQVVYQKALALKESKNLP
jgi:16S rRNA (cytidine1402-2'-O)-methyltransferase